MRPLRQKQSAPAFFAVGQQFSPVDLRPLLQLMNATLLASDYVRMGDARTWLLNGNNRSAEAGRMLVRVAGPVGRRIVLFDLLSKDGIAALLDLLEGASGYLQAGAVADHLRVSKKLDLVPVGCWRHCQQQFMEAFEVLPERSRRARSVVSTALRRVDALYRIEQQAQSLRAEQRALLRKRKALPILERLHDWVESSRQWAGECDTLDRAIGYCLKHWEALVRYAHDGSLEIDTGVVNAAILMFGTGRGRWILSGSVADAVNGSALYSLMATAAANGIEPKSYVRFVFESLAAARTDSALKRLLPFTRQSATGDRVVRGSPAGRYQLATSDQLRADFD